MKNQIRNHARAARAARKTPSNKASWWFARMRRVVDLALPSETREKAPHEQTYFPLRQITFL